MSQASSVSAKRRHSLVRVCRVWEVARSTVYAGRQHPETAACSRRPLRKRGPVGACSDEKLAGHIRQQLEDSPWVAEGHRKVWARLRHIGIRAARRRVLRVMRREGLLAPTRARNARGPKAHDRSITPDRPNELWGTDATSTLTVEGQATIFILIDHCTAECLGIHAARRGTRFEALIPVRQAVRERFGRFDSGAAAHVDLALRHDHGSQFVSHVFQDELKMLGIRSSPSFVREPQGNGCAERFIRTLKEQLLWLRRFDTVEELRLALLAFKERYNESWIIERHGHVSPREQYRRLNTKAAA